MHIANASIEAPSSPEAATSARRPVERIDDIEVLRAIAVLFILFEHRDFLLFWVPQWNRYLVPVARFWGGVDLFFVISGFVIARQLVPQLMAAPDRKASWRVAVAFWIRRAHRIIPSAWFWLAIIVAICLLFSETEAKVLSIGAFAILAQMQNFFIPECLIHFPVLCVTQGPAVSMTVYWSLSLEEQFYLLFPLLIIVLRSRLIFVLILLWFVQFPLARQLPDLLWFVRTDSIILGVLLALTMDSNWRRRIEPIFLGQSSALRWAFLIALLSAVVALAAGPLGPPSVGLMSLACCALVWIASYNKSYVLPDGFIKRGLMWVGARSYAIYLIHFPTYFMTKYVCLHLNCQIDSRNDLVQYGYVATALCIIGILSDANFRLLEQPLKRRGSISAKRYLEKRGL